MGFVFLLFIIGRLMISIFLIDIIEIFGRFLFEESVEKVVFY